MKLALVIELIYPYSMKKEELELFVFCAHEAGRLNLLKCSSGNLSQRIESESMLISGTKSWLAEISINEISQISINGDEILNSIKPSAEFRLHREILRRRKDVNTVLHFQSPSATTIACMDIKPDYNVIIEIPVYIGEIGYIPFLLPGSGELARAVGEHSIKTDLIQLANHGQVVYGKNYKDVLQKAVFFELACSVLLKSNFKAKTIPIEMIPILRNYNK
jgi:ribulose-5-phosphate 4-epimerase/fuculose-1-phosphate aldolase